MHYVKPLLESKSSTKGVLSTRTCSLMDIEKYNENGRSYPRAIFTDRILTKEIKDKMKKKCLLGEINHPKDRFESSSDKVAISMTNMWIDEDNQKLMGTFDVLDTPMGQIVETMLEYGSHIGISARALGKGRKTRQGEEIIPESYMFKTFDIVVDPGFFDSRVNPDNKELSEAVVNITETFDNKTYENLKPLLESLGCVYTNVDDNVGDDTTTNKEGSQPKGNGENPIQNTNEGEDSKALLGKIEKLESKVLELEYEKLDLEAENECLQSKVDIAESKYLAESLKISTSAMCTNVQHERVLGMLQKTDEALRTQESKHKSDKDRLVEANNKLAKKVLICEGQKKTLEDKNNTLLNENKVLKEALNNLFESKKAYKNAVSTVSEKYLEALDIIDSMQDEIEDLNENQSTVIPPKTEDKLQIVRILNENKQEDKVDKQTLRILQRINKN